MNNGTPKPVFFPKGFSRSEGRKIVALLTSLIEENNSLLERPTELPGSLKMALEMKGYTNVKIMVMDHGLVEYGLWISLEKGNISRGGVNL